MKTALHSLEEMAMAQERMNEQRGANRALMQLARPSAIRKPRVFLDGNKWCALDGENLQEGVCGFGDTPDAACRQFDIQWLNERPNALELTGAASPRPAEGEARSEVE